MERGERVGSCLELLIIFSGEAGPLLKTCLVVNEKTWILYDTVPNGKGGGTKTEIWATEKSWKVCDFAAWYQLCRHLGLSENSVPRKTQWFCWSLSRFEKWLAIIGNINPTFSDKPIWTIEWIGLRENLQETPILNGKNPWVSCRFSLKPIHWTIECVFINFIISFPSVLRHDNSKWNDWQNSWDWRDSSWQAFGRILDAFCTATTDTFFRHFSFNRSIHLSDPFSRTWSYLNEEHVEQPHIVPGLRKAWMARRLGLATLGRHQKGLTNDNDIIYHNIMTVSTLYT